MNTTHAYGVAIESNVPCPYQKTGPHIEAVMQMQVGDSAWFAGNVMLAGGPGRTMRNRGFTAFKYKARTENRDGKPGYRMWRTA